METDDVKGDPEKGRGVLYVFYPWERNPARCAACGGVRTAVG